MTISGDPGVLVLGRGMMAAAMGDALRARGVCYVALGRPFLDIRDCDATIRVLTQLQPDVVINAAAYNCVESAEHDPDTAWEVNACAPGCIASAVEAMNGVLIHVSTSDVFDGREGRPMRETDTPSPDSVYGETRLVGEQTIGTVMESGKHYILRTGPLWYECNYRCFPCEVRQQLIVDEPLTLDDRHRINPTYAGDVAEAILRLLDMLSLPRAIPSGVYHLANRGAASWYRFAVAVAAASDLDTTRLRAEANNDPAEGFLDTRLNGQKWATATNSRMRGWMAPVVEVFSGFSDQ